MAIKLKRFSNKSKSFGHDDYNLGSGNWSWVFHAVYDNGEEFIFYSDDSFDTKSECKDDMDQFIYEEKAAGEEGGGIIKKVDSKSCMKLTGKDMSSDLKKKYPKAAVQGV